jgi:hypothetical protein
VDADRPVGQHAIHVEQEEPNAPRPRLEVGVVDGH